MSPDARDPSTRWHDLLAHAPVGLFAVDGDGWVRAANDAWHSLVGLSPADVGVVRWWATVHHDDRDDLAYALGRPEELDHRLRVTLPDGVVRWLHLRLGAPDATGGRAGVAVDVSAAFEVDQQLAEACEAAITASRLKSEFLANVSHEIRTPLNAVLGIATLLLDTRLDEEQYEQLVTLRSAGEHLMSLLNDVLDFSRVEQGRIELEATDFELLPLVHDVASLFASAAFDRGVRVRVDVDSVLPRAVNGDPARLRQVLTNLVGNAVKFTEHGSVTIRLTAEGRDSSSVRFEIVDTGPGIAPEAQERIFEAFVQADASTTRTHGGTGLGLAICRQLVGLMGGVISLRSAVGEGSTFWFTIPFAPARRPVPEAAAVPAPGGPRRKLLLAEDNAVNQRVAIGLLRHLGYEVDVVGDGEAAVHAALTGAYAAVLMDCQMPRLDGFDATIRIRAAERERGGHLPVIALTAGALPGDRERCLEAGMDDHLTKPIEVARLGAVLDRWIGTASAAPVRPEVTGRLRSLPADDGTLASEVAGAVRATVPGRIDKVRALVDAQRWNEAAAEAHVIAGSAREVGAGTLADLALALESQCRRAHPDPLATQVLARRLGEVFPAVERELRQLSA